MNHHQTGQLQIKFDVENDPPELDVGNLKRDKMSFE